MLAHRLGGGGSATVPAVPDRRRPSVPATAAPPSPASSRRSPAAPIDPGCPSRPGTRRRWCCWCSTASAGSCCEEHRGDAARALGTRRGRDHDRRAVDHGLGADVDHHRARADPARGLGFRMRIDGAVLNVLRWTVDNGRHAPDPFSRAAPPAVPRPTGAGRDPKRVPRPGIHRGPPAGRAVPRLEHDGGARRALPHARRGTASGSCTPTTRVSTRSRTSSDCTTSTSARELAFADELVGRLLDALPPEAALRRDRGPRQVHVGDGWYDLTPARRARALLQRRGPVPLAVREQRRRPTSSRPRRGTSSAHQAWVLTRDELARRGLARSRARSSPSHSAAGSTT